jgi:hypothetical protein
MGVMASGLHDIGPNYWLGWTTAFVLAELNGDVGAWLAVWGIPGNPTRPPFGEAVAKTQAKWNTKSLSRIGNTLRVKWIQIFPQQSSLWHEFISVQCGCHRVVVFSQI